MIFPVLTSFMLMFGLVAIVVGIAYLLVPDATWFARSLMLISGSLLTGASLFGIRAHREAVGFEDWLWTNRDEFLVAERLTKVSAFAHRRD